MDLGDLAGHEVNSRRKVLLAFGACAFLTPAITFAQQRIARIGFLSAASPSGYKNRTDAFIDGLRKLGYIEGKNLSIEWRFAEARYELLPDLAAELVRSKVDLIVAGSPPSVRAAQRATTTIPIVMVAVGDPLGDHFVASLSRPGGNITGFTNLNVDISAKLLQLLRTVLPKLSNAAILIDPEQPENASFLERIEAAAKTSGIKVAPLRTRSATEIETALGGIRGNRASALVIPGAPLFLTQGPQIANLALKNRLPTMFWSREPVESGGLMSYGQNPLEQFRRIASYADKILKGAKAGDLPVEQATKFELVIDLKTAKALGIKISEAFLARADEVIQ